MQPHPTSSICARIALSRSLCPPKDPQTRRCVQRRQGIGWGGWAKRHRRDRSRIRVAAGRQGMQHRLFSPSFAVSPVQGLAKCGRRHSWTSCTIRCKILCKMPVHASSKAIKGRSCFAVMCCWLPFINMGVDSFQNGHKTSANALCTVSVYLYVYRVHRR